MRSLGELMDLRGRVALVTGGAGGIGRMICDTFAELGGSVAILDVRREQCGKVAAEIASARGVTAIALAADLEKEDEVRRVHEQVRDRLGRLDVLVNCAALGGSYNLTGWAVPFAEQSVGTWRRALEVNLTAPFLLSQTCAPLLADSGHGTIINIASIYGVVGPDPGLYVGTGMDNPAAYGASKGGLVQLTRYLATILAPKVRVNAISPGGLWARQAGPFVEKYTRRTPQGRMGVEEDLKGAIAYLATNLSAYVTGHNLVVDGGWTAW